jgi:hypothetical protein
MELNALSNWKRSSRRYTEGRTDILLGSSIKLETILKQGYLEARFNTYRTQEESNFGTKYFALTNKTLSIFNSQEDLQKRQVSRYDQLTDSLKVIDLSSGRWVCTVTSVNDNRESKESRQGLLLLNLDSQESVILCASSIVTPDRAIADIKEWKDILKKQCGVTEDPLIVTLLPAVRVRLVAINVIRL